jgi:hypothetical protein
VNGTTDLPKLDIGALKTDAQPPKQHVELRDQRIRLLLIPAFGIAIPHFAGYFGPLEPHQPLYWTGLAWAVLISFAIWHGNRFFLIKQREHYDWFDHPVRKITLLLFANVFYTAPVSVLMTVAWYRFAGFGPDWSVIRTVTLACVICVVFVTHVYETVYLIQQRESDLVAVERLERARAQAELESIKAQVTPHFLFNSLNTLGWLIEHSPARAVEFNQNLAEVYRYILVPGRRELIPLEEEWEFVLRYFRLLELRFGESVQMEAEDPGDRGSRWFVPPISVQPLVENAVKHNEHSPRHPLRIEIRLEGTRVVVGNDKRARLTGSAAAGTGLANLDERCRLVLGEGIEVIDTGARFTVRVPARVI